VLQLTPAFEKEFSNANFSDQLINFNLKKIKKI